jgi:hypothetical protein
MLRLNPPRFAIEADEAVSAEVLEAARPAGAVEIMAIRLPSEHE